MLLYVDEPDYSWSYSDTSCISVYYPCLFLIQGLFHSHWSAVLWWQFCTQQFDLHHQLVLSVLDVSLVGFVNQIHFLWCLSVLMTWNSVSWLVEWCVVGGRDGWCESERKWWKIEQDYLCHFNVVGVSDIWKSGVPTTHFSCAKIRGWDPTVRTPDFGDLKIRGSDPRSRPRIFEVWKSGVWTGWSGPRKNFARPRPRETAPPLNDTRL